MALYVTLVENAKTYSLASALTCDFKMTKAIAVYSRVLRKTKKF